MMKNSCKAVFKAFRRRSPWSAAAPAAALLSA
jgi:hypothetical protein